MNDVNGLPLRYRFVPPTDTGATPLLMLHGTGGDEHDLLPLGHALSPGAALLSPRGAVDENGAARFFRRLREGVFDEEDLGRRAAELVRFVEGARALHGLAAPVAVGFSNGANIAAALLLLHPGVLRAAVLIRAMPPLRQPPGLRIPGTPVLALSGLADPIAPPVTAARLVSELSDAGAVVTAVALPAGHGLTDMDVAKASTWLTEETLR